MVAPTILSSPIFMQIILPFLLVFTVIFAILERTKILGDGKTRINAITSLVIALIVVAYGFATQIIVSLMPFLAVGVVIILVFMILVGFVYGGEKGFEMTKYVKIIFLILISASLIIAIIVAAGYKNFLLDIISGKSSSSILTNIIFIVVIIAAVIAVIKGSSPKSSS